MIPLGVGAAISPAAITVQLVTLSGRSAPLARAFAIALGFALVAAADVALALALAKGAAKHHQGDAGPIVKLVAAGLLVLLGIRALTHTPAPKEAKPDRGPRLGEAVGLGAALMLTNFSSILLLFPAAHAIGISGVGFAGKALAVLILFAFVLLPAAGPPLAVAALGERGKSAMSRLNAFTTRHRQTISATLCFVFAAFLAVVGIEKLT